MEVVVARPVVSLESFASYVSSARVEGPVVCVLGCRSDSRTLERRARAARDVFFERKARLLLTSGGRAWAGRVEADVLRDLVAEAGVPRDAVVRERCSLDTRDNARFSAAFLHRRGVRQVTLVTCAWHLPRATKLFECAGLEVDGVGVEPENATLLQRTYWSAREAFTTWKDMRRGAILSRGGR
jgi:uncharacterized SAM-binding protein YcdF (DUF218 family)